MRVHRVARSIGLSTYLHVNGRGPRVNACLRVVRDADHMQVYTSAYGSHSRDVVVQWAFELGRALIAERSTP
jgi:hypothetical protein